jgi:formylglycine-generating enzyme required for sulfatase activity
VGSFPEDRSAQGVYDLLGNVAEWATAPGDPFLLGGGYTAAAPELRAEEQVNGARYHLPTIGFRCAASRGAHGR